MTVSGEQPVRRGPRGRRVLLVAVAVLLLLAAVAAVLVSQDASPDPDTGSVEGQGPSGPPGPFSPAAVIAGSGVPAGWEPRRTSTEDVVVTEAGAVVEDLLLTGADLVVAAPDVTVRRVEVQGGEITNEVDGACQDGLVLDQVTLTRAPGQVTTGQDAALGPGGYTARRVLIDGLPEGFRVGGASSGCGPVTIEDSVARVRYPDECGDWHGDALQGYDSPGLTLTNSVLQIEESPACGGTAPFFYPEGQGNAPAVVDGLLVSGGGYPFRLGTTARVTGLQVADGRWGYGPLDVRCSETTDWAATVVSVAPDGTTTPVRTLPCDT